MNVHVVCQSALALSNDELKARIPRDVLARIKKNDPNPYIKAWIFVHEGASRPYDYGQNSEYVVTKEGVRSAIKAAQKKLGSGLFFSDGHQITADPGIKDLDGREPVGQAVSVFSKSMGNREYGIVIGYFPPEAAQRAKAAEAVSVDAMWEAVEQPGILEKIKRFFVKMFASIDSIALLVNERPGFPEALELSEVKAQRMHVLAFDPIPMEQETQEKPKEQKKPMSDMEWNFENVKKWIRSNRSVISQIVEPEEIFGKRVTMPDGSVYFQGGDRVYNDWLVRHEAEMTADYKKQVSELQEIADQKAQLEKQLKSIEAAPMIEDRIKEMNGPEAMVKYAKRRMNGHDLSDEESITAFLKEVKADYEDMFGPIEKPKPKEPEKQEAQQQTEAGDSFEPNLGTSAPRTDEVDHFGPQDDL